MSTFYGKTNAVEKKGLKWNIMASEEIPTSSTPGKVGDVIIITSQNVKKIKKVATKKITDSDLQDNTINVFEDFTKDRILVNSSDGFNIYLQSTMQNIILDGESLIASVYFYDGLTNSWIPYSSAYIDNLSVSSFTGQDIDVDTYWSLPELIEDLDEEKILPTIDRVNVNDTMNSASFTGTTLDVDDYWFTLTLTEDANVTAYVPS